jgi:hypothetical protein
MKYIVYLFILFGGYALGRIGHIVGGKLDDRGIRINTPDHWVYGVLAIIVGAVFYKHDWGKWLIAFGIGHAISDLKDMSKLKFFGGDEPGPKKFWHID